MERKARLGIDIDGVLANFNESFRELIHTHTDVRLPAFTDTYPDMWDYHKQAGVGSTDNTRLWNIIKESNTFWKNLPTYPETYDFLQWASWLPSHVDVYFITSRPGHTAKAQTELWLTNNGWAEDFPQTVIISWKKGLMADALDLTHFIDDKNENVMDVLTNGPIKCDTYMLARPWNQQLPATTRIESLTNFRQVVEDYIRG